MEEEELNPIDPSAPFNASDPEQVASRKRKLGRKKKEEEHVVKKLMATSSGRAWILSLLESCHIYQMSFTGEALSTAFKEGERNIGLQVLALVTSVAPEEYSLMLKEKAENV